jgi:2-amino-4-hydroxy-6-hydroxymethyldihydropteridine diphosphokinase
VILTGREKKQLSIFHIMTTIAVSIGTNRGNRQWYMQQMERMLSGLLFPPITYSALMETEPLDVAEKQPWYLNRILTGNYMKSPFELLRETQAIERQLGRTEKGNRKDRTADIDILLFGTVTLVSAALIIPHPAIEKRLFVLLGLRECMPESPVGNSDKSVEDLCIENLPKLKKQNVRILHEGGSDEQ